MVKFECPFCGYSMQTAQYLNGKGHCLKCDAVVAETEKHPLNPEWTRKMKVKFDQLNSDGIVNKAGYGTLDRDEMAVLLRKGHADMTDDEIDLVFADADTNHNGTIEFTEFLWYLYGHPGGASGSGGGSRGSRAAPRTVDPNPRSKAVAKPKAKAGGHREPGEASTYKLAPSDACESDKGVCPKNDGGPHHYKFGRCIYCGAGEGQIVHEHGHFAYSGGTGGCTRDGGKCMYKFGKCSKCGKKEF